VIFGLYTRWLNSKALLIGWAVGMIAAPGMAASIGFRPIFPLEIFGTTVRPISRFIRCCSTSHQRRVDAGVQRDGACR